MATAAALQTLAQGMQGGGSAGAEGAPADAGAAAPEGGAPPAAAEGAVPPAGDAGAAPEGGAEDMPEALKGAAALVPASAKAATAEPKKDEPAK